MDNNEQTDMISKKELLIATGVSYGQLYRWKRERLIPDSWFVKKSSFTGQETFFPREKILTRIEAILEMKDSHSLEEMAGIFSPVLSPRMFHLDSLRHVEKLNLEALLRVAADYGQEFSFSRVLLAYLFTKVMERGDLTGEDKEAMFRSVRDWETRLDVAHQAILLVKGDRIMLMLSPDGTQIWPETGTKVTTYSLSELSRELRAYLMETVE